MPQFNALQNKFGKDKFQIIAFPANNFQLQQPGRNDEILKLHKYIRPGNNYTVNYLFSEKIDVNGANTPPLYQFLKNSCMPTRSKFAAKSSLFYDPLSMNDLRWNFVKFLIDKSGKPRYRVDPTGFSPMYESKIGELINE